MPEIMSELDYMDALAAEYVLGTLDVEERTQARTLLAADEAFAGKVQLWERRFGDLHLMVEPVEPDPAIWARIRAKMAQSREQSHAPEPPILSSAAETKTAEPPGPAAAAPPSLDAIETAISNAAATLSAEATAAPATSPAQPEAMPSASEAPPPVSDGTRPAAEVPPAGVEAGSPEGEMTRREAEMTATEAEMRPTEAEMRPTEAEVAPPEAEVAPREAEVTPQQAEVPPAQGEVTPSGLEVTPTSVSEASPAPISEAPSAPAADAQPVPAEATSAVEAMPTPPVAAAAAAVAEAASETRVQAVEPASLQRELRRWRAFAILMTLLVLAVVVLLAAWRFVPERLPSILQPLELMRHVGVNVPGAPRPRAPAPPESQFDE
jgi:hypothetical protein